MLGRERITSQWTWPKIHQEEATKKLTSPRGNCRDSANKCKLLAFVQAQRTLPPPSPPPAPRTALLTRPLIRENLYKSLEMFFVSARNSTDLLKIFARRPRRRRGGGAVRLTDNEAEALRF
ncbi:hypothetical protein EVAR_6198_1 [Eumeta japonica]|uniref:Uncharacterized protein n=1 Tax=Eumeta variegata TaxID=151549 RepID=A0A4C2A437_EUMVA|nr:hypothetical protein EVAR_6198_1 [Eumeta japonica]